MRDLQTALAPTDWQTWAERTDEPLLYEWTDSLDSEHPTVCRLQIAESQGNFSQPDLQTWLGELSHDNAQPLASRLKLAWENAQQQAFRLARLLQALANPNYQGNLFRVQVNLERSSLDYRHALAALILGEAAQKVTSALQHWLSQQGEFDLNTPVLDIFNALKHRFNRATAIYHQPHTDLDWKKTFKVLKTLKVWARIWKTFKV